MDVECTSTPEHPVVHPLSAALDSTPLRSATTALNRGSNGPYILMSALQQIRRHRTPGDEAGQLRLGCSAGAGADDR